MRNTELRGEVTESRGEVLCEGSASPRCFPCYFVISRLS